MIAFVESVRRRLIGAGMAPQDADEFHKLLTSYDVEDPALMLQLLEAGNTILTCLEELKDALVRQALTHQWTFMIARTHGQFAEPTTFGQLLLVFASAVMRAAERIRSALQDDIRVGKMSGAVGTYAGIDPRIEEHACCALDLLRADAATQILQRDRHASLLAALTIAGCTIEQIMRTFWVMMHGCVGELEEPRTPRQRGSSAMPQKKNPILTERLIGLSRVLRGNLQAALENVGVIEWREISQSSVERIVLADSTTLLHYMATKAAWVVQHLVVHSERMQENLESTHGTWAAQRIRHALTRAGVADTTAYELLQRASFQAVQTRTHLRELLRSFALTDQDPRSAVSILGPEALEEACFDVDSYLRPGIETIFARFAP